MIKDGIFPFIQEDYMSECRKLDSLNDLRRNFDEVKMIVRTNYSLVSIFWKDRHKETNKILSSHFDFDDDLSYYTGSKLFVFDERDHDDEDVICIKTMLMIYHYFIVSRETMTRIRSEAFVPFLYYVEENVLKEVFDCAKKLKKEAYNGQVRQFETGIGILEAWQKIVLHLYTKLQVDIFSYRYLPISDMEKYYNSCFVMLTTLKYMKEKKVKYLKENNDQNWKQENQPLMGSNISFWPPFLKDIFSIEIDELDELRSKILNCIPIYIELIYKLTGLSLEDDTEDLKVDATKMLTLAKLANTDDTRWSHLFSLMKKDYEEVKDMEASNITNEQSENFGDHVYIVKGKIMNTLGFVLMEKEYEDQDELIIRHDILLRVSVLLQFKDLIIENLKRNEIKTQYEGLLRESANIISLPAVCLDVDKLEEIPEEFKQMISCILEIWKNSLFSSNRIIRSSANRTIARYFLEKEKCSDDLLGTIINAGQANITNIKEYCEMLENVSCCFDVNNMNGSMLERFRQLISNLFETIIMSDTIEYLKDMQDLSDEEKLETHKENVIECFDMIETLFGFINDNIKFEKILLVIKKKTEEIFEKDEFKLNDELILSTTKAMAKIIKETDLNALSRVFEQFDFYPFLTKFIRIVISKKKVDTAMSNTLADIGSLAVLIENLYEKGLLIHCPFDVNEIQSEEKKDFLYDYLFNELIEASIPSEALLTHLSLIIPSFPSIVQSLQLSASALSSIILNEIVQNGGEQLLSHVTDEHFETAHLALMKLSNIDLFEEVLIAILLLTRNRSFAISLYDFLPNLLVYPFKATVPKEKQFLIFGCIFEFVEYLFDTDSLDVEDHDFTNVLFILRHLDQFPISVKIQAQRVIRKIETLESSYSSDSDTSDSSYSSDE
ncbi:predicted protein [Naegleria gruberi]|uniref:Predicted protein n=1 Tax=Naegleria gruberi TaxID=5762 RepID=D2W2G4_NAEGR|nr:uncharacterized protein NAEGRDRAFT_75579 [Naegleria gruberi]EFC36744.1 predicted protein [Naegleria gruberi]|eukprot:XP_002669488.1 predicted protein [Naegleria gruberi strain NEG-M]